MTVLCSCTYGMIVHSPTQEMSLIIRRVTLCGDSVGHCVVTTVVVYDDYLW